MNCVEDCGYNNFSLLRVIARVFSLKAFLSICGQYGVYSMGRDKVYQI